MLQLILVIFGSWIVSGVLNRLLGNTPLGVVGIGITILPFGLAIVRHVEPLVVIIAMLVGAGIFIFANKHRYLPKAR